MNHLHLNVNTVNISTFVGFLPTTGVYDLALWEPLFP